MENTLLSVSDFIALTNQTLEYAYPVVTIEGEVSSFKINQGKFIFFDLKDSGASIGCFMMAYQLRLPIEDGMKVIITASPKLTQWGKFSLTVRTIRPSGEGALKKSFELLKEKLTKEGLFAAERKRSLPTVPTHVAVISSTAAAGYGDFVKIINERWGGLKVDVAHVQVQGSVAPDQMIRAIQYFNGLEELPEVLVLIRGGGSADDLSAFNDELLVRAIAQSRIPTLVGVGHEMDESLADMAADVRAATPSNAAQILVPDKREIIRATQQVTSSLTTRMLHVVTQQSQAVKDMLVEASEKIQDKLDDAYMDLANIREVLQQLNPMTVLARGYALIRGVQKVGQLVEVETSHVIIKAEVTHVTEK